MRRIIAILGGAVVGAAGGNALFQLRHGELAPSGEEAQEMVIAAPFTVIAIAFVAGLLTRSRSGTKALITGLVVGAAVGTDLDEQIGPLQELRRPTGAG